MANIKGSPKTGGRRKGTPNKVTASTKQWIADFLGDNRERFALMMECLQPIEFVKVYLSLLQYEIPKRQAIGLQDMTPRELAKQFNWSTLTEEQREALESLPDIRECEEGFGNISINIAESKPNLDDVVAALRAVD